MLLSLMMITVLLLLKNWKLAFQDLVKENGISSASLPSIRPANQTPRLTPARIFAVTKIVSFSKFDTTLDKIMIHIFLCLQSHPQSIKDKLAQRQCAPTGQLYGKSNAEEVRKYDFLRGL